MDDRSNETMALVLKYTNIPHWNTEEGRSNTYTVLTRKKNPFWDLADEICKRLRKQPDDISLLFAKAFIKNHSKNLIPSRLVDDENIMLFASYYIDRLPLSEISESFSIDDERTIYKKLKESRKLFAVTLYRFCIFINQ